MTVTVVRADCIEFLDSLAPQSVDLVLGSPPYMDARTYGINAVYDCRERVEWMLRVTEAAVRVSKGLVLWVAAGVQRDLCYWPGCEGLMWEWWRRGGDCHLWCPAVWWKVDQDDGGTGIPGSGGSQGMRKDWEYVMQFKRPGHLPWADNTAMGHEPVYGRVGGEMSNRTADGRRINEKVGRGVRGRRSRWADGEQPVGATRRQNGEYKQPLMPPSPVHDADGNVVRAAGRPFPKIANPGNVLPLVVKARVGGGHMGSRLCHAGEAPFPENLAEFWILSYCPPAGIVCDPFCGSGTTATVAVRHRRNFAGCDIRQSQVDLTLHRVSEETPMLFT